MGLLAGVPSAAVLVKLLDYLLDWSHRTIQPAFSYPTRTSPPFMRTILAPPPENRRLQDVAKEGTARCGRLDPCMPAVLTLTRPDQSPDGRDLLNVTGSYTAGEVPIGADPDLARGLPPGHRRRFRADGPAGFPCRP